MRTYCKVLPLFLLVCLVLLFPTCFSCNIGLFHPIFMCCVLYFCSAAGIPKLAKARHLTEHNIATHCLSLGVPKNTVRSSLAFGTKPLKRHSICLTFRGFLVIDRNNSTNQKCQPCSSVSRYLPQTVLELFVCVFKLTAEACDD